LLSSELSDDAVGDSYELFAKCNVVNPVDNIAVIEISGRSKCGRAYSEDEVLVEILKKEGQNEYILKNSQLLA
jgi:hypothetical protein